MQKNGVRGYLILVVLFVVLSVIAFAAPFSRTGVFWIAYVFATIAIVYQIYVFKISFSGEGDVKSKFYGFPIANVGVIYLVVQTIVSLLEMVVAAILPLWASLIVNVIILALAVIGCIASDVMRDEIIRQDERLKRDVSNMRGLQSMSAALVGQCADSEVRVLVQKLSEEFKYSDPVSSEQTQELEKEIKIQLGEMQRAIIDGDNQGAALLENRIRANLNERNRICSLGK
jgi:hypothetical protein